MSHDEIREMFRIWESPGSLEAPEGIDDAAEIDGILPLPGLSVREIRKAASA
jgi:hypothetical protein